MGMIGLSKVDISANFAFALAAPILIANFWCVSKGMISDGLTKPAGVLKQTFRPAVFADFRGQAKVKERFDMGVTAAKHRGEPLDHILISGLTMEKPADFADVLTNLEEGDVLFIDEIHYPPCRKRKFLSIASRSMIKR
jgi:Holliday junction resolvasome RuvABC ATP-dependent DNA helicase subunit